MTTHSFAFPTPAISQTDPGSSDTAPAVATALICDTPLVRSGLQRLLSGTPFVLVEDGPATAPRLGSDGAPGPALCILAVGQLSSRTPEMIRQAKERHPAARIVLLADHFDLGFVTQGREAGADGFCLTSSSREVLITSLELVMLGELALPTELLRAILDAVPFGPQPETASEVPQEAKASYPGARSLSAREAEILSALMEGEPNKIIARKFHVTEATVKVHVKAILRKIGAANRTQAAIWAMGHPHG